jgi:thiol-disulfide isomerase/thioredoxin
MNTSILSRWGTAIGGIALFALAVFGLYRVAAPRFVSEIARPAIEFMASSAAPEFAALDMEKRVVKLSEFRGKKVIIIFWTSWNDAAREYVRSVGSLYGAGEDGTVILAINSQENEAAVRRAFPQGLGAARMLLEESGEIGEMYNIGTLPLTVFADRAGSEGNRIVGPIEPDEVRRIIGGMR